MVMGVRQSGERGNLRAVTPVVLKAEILSDTARASLSGVLVPVSPARVTVDPTACVRVWGLGKPFVFIYSGFWGWGSGSDVWS